VGKKQTVVAGKRESDSRKQATGGPLLQSNIRNTELSGYFGAHGVLI
jgi:hypothetical protein